MWHKLATERFIVLDKAGKISENGGQILKFYALEYIDQSLKVAIAVKPAQVR